MFLSRLILNPRSRQVRAEIANLYEMHRTVLHAFAGPGSDPGRVLFRLDIHPRTSVPTLLVQSPYAPDWSFLLAPGKDYLLPDDALPLGVENPAVKPLELRLRAGQTLAFRLRANPTVKKDRAGHEQGRRAGLLDEKAQLDWLKRKIEAAGGALLSASAVQQAFVTGSLFRGNRRHELKFLAVQFDGVLAVQDPQRLTEAVAAGIGSAKGLGFGLLSLAPAGG
mgnify:CR=1 FL=1